MLVGVGLGPGDPELLTIKAVKAIEEADEVIVPGKLAYDVVSRYRKPRLVEFPMGMSEKVEDVLSDELANRCVEEDVVFATLGDVAFFSTFQHIATKTREKNPDVEIRMIPGVPSFTAVFSKLNLFVDAPILITTPELRNAEYVVVLKAKKPREIARELEKRGYDRFVIAERIFMDGEYLGEIGKAGEIEERADYFTLLVGLRI
jgi:precorrin-2/cobalt-factor-2 C20-methyltransferase